MPNRHTPNRHTPSAAMASNQGERQFHRMTMVPSTTGQRGHCTRCGSVPVCGRNHDWLVDSRPRPRDTEPQGHLLSLYPSRRPVMRRLLACLALVALAGPALACVNDMELPAEEREF